MGSLGEANFSRRNKLGVALAGGGFRASLFHMGVLRRMAELDLLRYVETLSTVSGGSIIGALYLLVLKKHLDRSSAGVLSRDQYIEITKEVEEILVAGIQKNPRTRLFMNPLGVLSVLLTQDSLGKRMARIYERYLYQAVVGDLRPQTRWDRWLRPGRILLSELRMTPGGKKLEGGIEAYNEEQVKAGGSAVTHLILNATSLNSGARFWFSHTEVGDWYLGHFRRSEIGILLSRKRLLETVSLDTLKEKLEATNEGADRIRFDGDDAEYTRDTVSLAVWWREIDEVIPTDWTDLFDVPGFPGKLTGAALGALRQAKIPAWYLRKGMRRRPPVAGALEPGQHLDMFWEAFRRIDEELHARLKPMSEKETRYLDRVLDFVLELYWLRSADVVSSRIMQDWDKLTLGYAVGASACFPPVFPPFLESGFYDDLHVSRLGLTDGGVFDNIGLTALGDEHCNYIIASDTSGLFGLKQRSSAGRIQLTARITSILMEAISRLQRETLREGRRVSSSIEKAMDAATDEEVSGPWRELRRFLAPRELEGLAFFHINSPPVPLPPDAGPALNLPVDGGSLARLRTDLDAFGDVEIDALINHGYATADRYIHKYLADKELFAPSAPYWFSTAQPPRPVSKDLDRARRIIYAGQSRFFRALKLGAPLSWIFTVSVMAILITATWNVKVSIRAGVDGLTGRVGAWLDGSIWLLNAGWTEWKWPVGWVCLALVLTLVLGSLFQAIIGTNAESGSAKRRRRRWWTRWASTSAKWMRLYAGNLLWLVKALPIVLAAGVSLAALVGHLFYSRPFLRKTRR